MWPLQISYIKEEPKPWASWMNRYGAMTEVHDLNPHIKKISHSGCSVVSMWKPAFKFSASEALSKRAKGTLCFLYLVLSDTSKSG